ncbi:MAG: hypothetical protein WBW33_30185, partial [Bryobacteraceae bacterium]
ADSFDLSGARIIPASEVSFDVPPQPPAEPTLLVASECHEYADRHPNFYSLIQPELFRKYRINSPARGEGRERLVVAVHIRRGDVNGHAAERFTSNSHVALQIDELSRSLAPLPHEFHVYSQGNEEDFGEILKRAILHLGGNVFECLESLISADIFVMAKSSFSYTAALLARGIVIYSPFWHAPLQQWIVTGERGDVCRSQLRAALIRKMLVRTARR